VRRVEGEVSSKSIGTVGGVDSAPETTADGACDSKKGREGQGRGTTVFLGSAEPHGVVL